MGAHVILQSLLDRLKWETNDKKTLFNESLVQANVWCTCTKPSFIETSPTFNLENGNGGKQDSRSVSG